MSCLQHCLGEPFFGCLNCIVCFVVGGRGRAQRIKMDVVRSNWLIDVEQSGLGKTRAAYLIPSGILRGHY